MTESMDSECTANQNRQLQSAQYDELKESRLMIGMRLAKLIGKSTPETKRCVARREERAMSAVLQR